MSGKESIDSNPAKAGSPKAAVKKQANETNEELRNYPVIWFDSQFYQKA